MNRLFLGLTPEGLDENRELKQLLGKLKRTLSDQDKECKWVPPANWHVTLVFLGSVSEEKTEQAKDLLQKWQSPVTSLELKLSGLGAFPSTEGAKMLWMGVAAEQELLNAQSALETLYANNGFALENEHSYKPHLTLVRFRNSMHINELIKLAGRKTIGRYPVSQVVLYESVLQGRFPKYIPLLRKNLGGMHKL